MKFKLLFTISILILSSNGLGQFVHDTDFSEDGFANANPHNGGNGSALTSAIERLPDGKYLIAGTATGFAGGTHFAMTVQKVNADGTVDTTFGGGDGVWAISPNGLNAGARGIVVQPDGKIIVAGYTTITVPAAGNISRETLARLNPDGSLDSTFASGGIYIQPHPINDIKDIGTEAFDVELMANGNIVTGGNHRPRFNSLGDECHNNEGAAPPCSAIAIYNSSGTNLFRDYFDFGVGVDTEFLSDIEVQDDGKIVAAISNANGRLNDFSIVRFNSNGIIDPTFGTNGFARTSNFFGRTDLKARNVEIQPDGKLLLTGNTTGLITARFNSDGTLDNSYGMGGKTESIASATSGHIAGESTIILPSGKILINGGRDSLVRLNPNGSLDTSFGDDGTLRITPLTSVGHIADMLIEPDGKITYASLTSLLGSGQGQVSTWLVGRLQPNRAKFDFDGDAKTDVSIFRPSNGQWWLLNSSDSSSLGVAFGVSSDQLVPEDFTGDGKTDIALFRPSSNQWIVLRSEDFSFFAFPFGTAGDIPAPGDFDGDGMADATVYRPSTGTWFTNRSNDGGLTVTPFGIAEDKPVVADYDGDGVDDVAVFRPSVSEWYLNRSSEGFIGAQFGSSGDQTVQGDWTGDGKDDVALFRPSTNQWIVLRSEDFSFFAFPFGAAGDIPSPGDYDGDGLFDAAVFRPSTQTWFKEQTTNGFEAVTFGLSDDVPIPSVYSTP